MSGSVELRFGRHPCRAAWQGTKHPTHPFPSGCQTGHPRDTKPREGSSTNCQNRTKSFLLFHGRGAEMAWNVQAVEALFYKSCYILWTLADGSLHPVFPISFPFLVSSIRAAPSSPLSGAHPALPFHFLGKPVTVSLFNKNVGKKNLKKE